MIFFVVSASALFAGKDRGHGKEDEQAAPQGHAAVIPGERDIVAACSGEADAGIFSIARGGVTQPSIYLCQK